MDFESLLGRQLKDDEVVEVLDVLGRTRNEVIWTDNKLDFSNSEAGIYFVKATIKNHQMVTRIVKK